MKREAKIALETKGKQTTIAREIVITGQTPFIANHETRMTIRPSRGGIRFIVTKNGKKRIVDVISKNTTSASGENTTLVSSGGVEVKTVEHILSSLSGLGINACEIELEGSNQVPVPDSSSECFTNGLLKSGKNNTAEGRIIARVQSDIFFTDDKGSLAILRPSDKLTISVLIQFPEPIGEQYIKVELNPKNYVKDICWARSYVRRNCDEEVWRICREQIPALPEDMTKSPILVFNNNVWVVKPKVNDEPARHKLLDALGDLSTLGYPLVADVTLVRPGHEFNRKLVNYLYGLLPKA